MAWYVRFKNAKVARTVSEDAPGYIYAMDFDSHGDMIGFELLGPRQFSFEMLLKLPEVDFSGTDFSRATFVTTLSRRQAALRCTSGQDSWPWSRIRASGLASPRPRRKAHHPSPLFVPEAEGEAPQTGEQSEGLDGVKEWFGPVALLEVIIGDARAQMVDMVEA